MTVKFTPRNHGNFTCDICGNDFPKAQHNQVTCAACQPVKKNLTQMERNKAIPRRARPALLRPEMSKKDTANYLDAATGSPCLDCAFLADCRSNIFRVDFDPYCQPVTTYPREDDRQNWRHEQYLEKYVKNDAGSWSAVRE